MYCRRLRLATGVSLCEYPARVMLQPRCELRVQF